MVSDDINVIGDRRIISLDTSIENLLLRIEKERVKVLFVVDNRKRLVGSITEGDLRRYTINNGNIPRSISDVMNVSPRHYLESDLSAGNLKIHDMSRGQIPILNDVGQIKNFFPSAHTFEGKNANPNEILAIAPTRISFAGGGSDVEYWFKEHFGCVVNLAISKYARVGIKKNYSDVIKLRSLNTGEALTLSIRDLSNFSGDSFKLITSCLKNCNLQEGLDIEIFCDYEPGTGLGGSSSLVVALLRGIGRLFNYPLSNYELIKLAYICERVDAGINGGWQDQIAAVNGGLCVSNFSPEGFRTYKVQLEQKHVDYLDSCLFISRVGDVRRSSEIHDHQKAASRETNFEEKMNSIVSLANESVDLIGQEKIDELGKILHEGWLLKRSLGEFISNPTIDERYQRLQDFGATGGRLLGAGASGFLLVYVDPSKQFKFINSCADFGIPIERIKIDLHGARTL